jgi:hypothetical protein
MTSDPNSFEPPDPILDALELDLIAKLAFEYEKFTSPGVVTRSLGTALKWTQRVIARMTPEKVQKLARDAIDASQEAELIKIALRYASHGFGELTKQSSSLDSRHVIPRSACLCSLVDMPSHKGQHLLVIISLLPRLPY